MIAGAVSCLARQRAGVSALSHQLRELDLEPAIFERLCREAPQLGLHDAAVVREYLKAIGLKPVGLRVRVALELSKVADASSAAHRAPCNHVPCGGGESDGPPVRSLAVYSRMLRGDLRAIDMPGVFSQPASSAPDERTAALVRAAITGADAKYRLRGDGASKAVCIDADGDDAVGRWTCHLCECGDATCGTYRLKRPGVRRSFRELVSGKTSEALLGSGRGVRYVSIGSGGVLFDFELLSQMRRAGLRIETITLVDTAYGPARPGESSHKAAIAQLAAFFAPARVHTFELLESLRAAASHDPSAFSQQTTFVACDASSVNDDEIRSTAAACLADGGLAFRLNNLGDKAIDLPHLGWEGSSSIETWWCSARPGVEPALIALTRPQRQRPALVRMHDPL